MKKTLPALSLLIAVLVTSCTKNDSPQDETIKTMAGMNFTHAIDSLKQKTETGFVTHHFDINPVTAAKWRFQFWWSDGIGYSFPAPENIGHGIRYTPIDPRIPDGERVEQKFTWWMEKPGGFIAIIGGNRAEITIIGNRIIMHQLPVAPGEIEQWYYGHTVPNGDHMDGKGPKLPG